MSEGFCDERIWADYWKSQARKFCDFCKCWIADNKPSIEFHEGGKKHKENVGKRLKEIHRNSAKQAKQQKKFENDIEKMEKAANAAYLKDVESNIRDMTADRIIHEKWNKTEGSKAEEVNPNRAPDAAPDAHPRFSQSSYRTSYTAADIDPLDPYAKQKLARLEARNKQKAKKEAAKNEEAASEAGGEKGKGKGKGKKSNEEASVSHAPVRKVWYEAKSQGYSYYWNTETNETIWEIPAEGYMSLEEQAEEAKERELQEQLLQQLDEEEKKTNVDVLEEQRANAEREKLREVRKRYLKSQKNSENKDDSDDAEAKEESDEDKIPYRRDYSVPAKPQPYGAWQVVRATVSPQIDLQLPKRKTVAPAAPAVSIEEPPPPQKVFKEKTITHVSTGDSDDEGAVISFKKRKFGNKNVRRRTSDD